VRAGGFIRVIALAGVTAATGGAGASGTTSREELIAFTSASNYASQTDITVMALDDSRRRNLTKSRTPNQQTPSWSPDGTRLVFDGGRFPHITLYAIQADGTGLRSVLGKASRFDFGPSWSPDGSWIAFVRGETPAGADSTFAVHPDGSGLRRFTVSTVKGTPSWSPDGKRIAFVGLVTSRGADGRRHGQSEIFFVRSDGSGLRRLTHSRKDDRAPVWSPDGTRIAFTSDRNARLEEQDDIYVMRADGSGQTRLTENQSSPTQDALLGHDFGPSWSPDGTRIAFTSGRDGNDELYVMNADGSCETRLTDTPKIDETDVTWRPTLSSPGAGRIHC
jgi:Tol biopolymer transport system component